MSYRLGISLFNLCFRVRGCTASSGCFLLVWGDPNFQHTSKYFAKTPYHNSVNPFTISFGVPEYILYHFRSFQSCAPAA